ncbi:MAG TPA: hypothetical protein ENJ00_03020 [Phycisphaerales bacterium]|nr:hypothetical protein [Phycisphaerales bacterium]
MKLVHTLAIGAAFVFSGCAVGQTTHDVIVGPNNTVSFSPKDITIAVGDTVHWIWEGGGHNVGSGLPGAPTSAFLSGPPAPAGTEFSVTFDQAFLDANPIAGNLYDYHCHPHGEFGMVGSITVTVGRLCADQNDNGTLEPSDFTAWIANFNAGDLKADTNQNGTLEPSDFTAWIAAFNMGSSGPICNP